MADLHAADHRLVTTAGHVDHGKSTLLRTLTGMEPDRLAEERRRGLTLDLGYAWTQLDDGVHRPRTVAFVDVPGHERFVTTMLAGAGAAPTALLVVAADDGWSRQSSEHHDVLDLLGTPAVALVVTKADTVDAQRVEQVCAQVRSACAGGSLHGAPIVVTDALSGRGVDDLRQVIADRLEVLSAPVDAGRPRLWVDRSFAVPGAGTVVTGTLTEGWLRVGDDVIVLPGGMRSRLRGVQSLNTPVLGAGPGHRVALNLVGIDHDQVSRGDVVVSGTPWRVTDVVECWVRTLPGHRVQSTGAWHLHAGSAATPVRLLEVTGPFGGDDATLGAVRLLLDEPLPLVAGDRFVLRETGRRAVAAGGVVATPQPPRRPRGDAERLARARAIREIAEGDRATRLLQTVELRDGVLDRATLFAAVGWDPQNPLPTAAAALRDHIVSSDRLAVWRSQIEELPEGTHDRAVIAERLTTHGVPQRVVEALIDELVDAGVLVRLGGGFTLPRYVDDATRQRRRRADAVIARLDESPFAPPDMDEAAREIGVDRREIAMLVQEGQLVRCGKVTFTRGAVERAAEILRTLGADGRPFTASEAKEAWGTSRKFAIPLLEHLDRTGVTRFDGQHRTIR